METGARYGAGLAIMSLEAPTPAPNPAPNEPDWYLEKGLLVYTSAYHLRRGSCCGSGCRHCPYEPKHVAGNQTVRSPPGDEPQR